jgi:hypothetical protein
LRDVPISESKKLSTILTQHNISLAWMPLLLIGTLCLRFSFLTPMTTMVTCQKHWGYQTASEKKALTLLSMPTRCTGRRLAEVDGKPIPIGFPHRNLKREIH